MQEFLADLHIHSRFSRATSRKLDIPLLAAWARVKGLSVLGTGDFTHPKWREEIGQYLRYEESSGLYVLKDYSGLAALLPELPLHSPALLRGGKDAPVARFMLQGEISSIYKRGGKVRKVHNLVFMPTLEAAERFSTRLSAIGNLHSDGRPILGLDSRDLLEMVLETDPGAFLVPAHIWTPWFSVFGSKSGFNRIADCFGDLTKHIFALETGLSSDPAMNRMWSELDPFRLISNSDAHSGDNLGREANLFAGEISYDGMLNALRRPQSGGSTAFLGTLEFYPEEGKYHMDGHRKCGVQLSPEETRACGGICPVCGQPVTVGVLYRVMELADRQTPLYQPGEVGDKAPGEGGFASLVPLPEVLAEILGVGAKTRKVADMYSKVLERFGPELDILRAVPTEDLSRFFPPLGEAVRRMRSGEVQLNGGFDGEYGTVTMFSEQERAEIQRGAGVSAGKKKMTPQGLPLLEAAVAAKTGKQGKKTKSRAMGGAPSLLDYAQKATQAPEPQAAGEDGEDFLFSSIDSLPLAEASVLAPPEETPLPAQESASAPEPLPKAAPPLPESKPKQPPRRITASFAIIEPPVTQAPSAQPESAAPAQPAPAAPAQPAVIHEAPAEPCAEESDTPEETRDTLNPEQNRAMLAGHGPVLVLAGPGTGKTRTLVARALHLMQNGARRIVAVTFTRRAAAEMDARLSEALGDDIPLPRTDTLHALALETWHKTHADVPVLLSEDGARQVFAEANPEDGPQALREAWQAINLARERVESPPAQYHAMAARYSAHKSAWNLADYTDLLEFWLEQIQSGLYTPPWTQVLVDEIQDLSPLQLQLIKALLPPSGNGFFGIGDPDQSIYGFRGAHGQCLEFFNATWSGVTCIRLTQNYRSRKGVLEAAHAVITKAGAEPEGRVPLSAHNPGAAYIALFEAPSARSEANWVAERIAELIGLGSHTLADAAARQQAPKASQGDEEEEAAYPEPPHAQEADHTPGDIAVLLRTHALAPVYRKALSQRGVPVSAPATDAFWADERVTLILHMAGRMLGISLAGEEQPRGPADPPLCPDKVLAKGPLGVSAFLSSFPPFDELFWKSPPFRALVKAYDANRGWAGLMTWINLQNELELVRGKAESVQLMTLHAAKGLEFRTVFMPALEDGLLPFAGPELLTGKLGEDKGQGTGSQEERRLFFVGLTRARESLYLSCAGKRMLYGKELRLKPSRFLAFMPKALLARTALVARTVRREKELRLI